MVKVLITGGAGFIGQYSEEKLVKVGYDVTIYDIQDMGNREGYIEGDIFDFDTLKEIVERNNVIIHLVGFPDAPNAQKNPMRSFKLNIVSLQNVLEACRLCGNKKVIFPSTAAVYGITQNLPVSENYSANPSSIYSWHKYICEKLIQTYHYNYGISYVTLRLFNAYGKGNKGVIHSFIEKARRGETIEVYGAEQSRDFVYASDVAEAFYASIIHEEAANKIINIGSGTGTKIKEILQMITEIYPDLVVKFKESTLVEYDSIADMSLAKALLDFKPRISKESMKETIKREMI